MRCFQSPMAVDDRPGEEEHTCHCPLFTFTSLGAAPKSLWPFGRHRGSPIPRVTYRCASSPPFCLPPLSIPKMDGVVLATNQWLDHPIFHLFASSNPRRSQRTTLTTRVGATTVALS